MSVHRGIHLGILFYIIIILVKIRIAKILCQGSINYLLFITRTKKENKTFYHITTKTITFIYDYDDDDDDDDDDARKYTPHHHLKLYLD